MATPPARARVAAAVGLCVAVLIFLCFSCGPKFDSEFDVFAGGRLWSLGLFVLPSERCTAFHSAMTTGLLVSTLCGALIACCCVKLPRSSAAACGILALIVHALVAVSLTVDGALEVATLARRPAAPSRDEVVAIVALYVMDKKRGAARARPMPELRVVGRPLPARGALADGCRNVYLDVGGNIGVQVRKLFEPDRYVCAGVHKLSCEKNHFERRFERHFGNRSSRARTTCAIGFEPNPRHAPRLGELARRYNALGFRTTYLLAAVGVSNASLQFEGGRWMSELEMAAKLTANRNDNGYDVPVIDLAEFILHHVHGRRLPVDDGLAAGKPAVVAKIDIEGEEKKVIPRLLATRAACAIDEMLVEWHGMSQIKQKQLNERCEKNSENCTQLREMDDEAFAIDPFPLPCDPERNGTAATCKGDVWASKTVLRDGAFWLENRTQTHAPALRALGSQCGSGSGSGGRCVGRGDD